ncbi:MAG: monovalent cation/H+ antiporter subunit E [Halodesulfurarchaeum sp.]
MAESTGDLLVPVGASETIRNTVAYAIREAGASSSAKVAVHFVFPVRGRSVEGTRDETGDVGTLLTRVEAWAADDIGELSEDVQVTVHTQVIGEGRYLFSSGDYASTLAAYARENNIDRIILDPEYAPGGSAPMLLPLKSELAVEGYDAEQAPVARATRRSPLPTRANLRKSGILFGLSFGFYLLVGGTLTQFNVLTGALVAGIVSLIFGNVLFVSTPRPGLLLGQLARFGLYVPYLLWEIAKANVIVAYIILHPRLPIDPAMREYRAAVWGEYSVSTLANSITLTPGTLTVDVRDDSLFIHTLTEDARVGLKAGGLERAVRYVFGGRAARQIPSPGERDAIEPVAMEEDG